MPLRQIVGKVSISATFCYVCQTDPHTPGDYTRAGLDIVFRPNKNIFPKNADGKQPDPDFPASKSFFEGVGRKTEQTLRSDAFKWDTLRHAHRQFQPSTLNSPVFDIHYVARQPGAKGTPSSATRLPYALVIEVSAKKHPTLYDEVVSRYPNVLEAIRPRTRLPIRVRR